MDRSLMRVAVCLGVLVLLGAGSLAEGAEPAWAEANPPRIVCWPLTGPADTLLGFGEAYLAPSGAVSVHRGLDLAAAPGDAVISPVQGVVTFCGPVPSANGGTHLAATIETGEGGVLSFTPLERTALCVGDRVGVGAPVGAVAEAGDSSGGPTHLHVSLRIGGEYVDPTVLLHAPARAESLDITSSSASVCGPAVSLPPAAPAGVAAAERPTMVAATRPTTVVEIATRPSWALDTGSTQMSLPILLAESAHRSGRVPVRASAPDTPIVYSSEVAASGAMLRSAPPSGAQTAVLAMSALVFAFAAMVSGRFQGLPIVSHRRE